MVEGLISLTLLTSKGMTTKPLLGLVVTNGLALVGGTALGGLVAYPLSKRGQAQEKERLSQALQQAQTQIEEADGLRQALQQAQGQVEEADGLRQELAAAQAEIGHLLSNAAEVAQVIETALKSEGKAPEVSIEVAEAPQVAEVPQVPQVPEAVPAPVPDDLKRVKGIGKVFEARLNEAGIWTFADLIDTDPEKLRGIVSSGRVENMIQPEEWIEQAREWVE